MSVLSVLPHLAPFPFGSPTKYVLASSFPICPIVMLLFCPKKYPLPKPSELIPVLVEMFSIISLK